MAETNGRVPPHRLKHIRIERFRSEAIFSPPQRDMSGIRFIRNRNIHGPKLEGDLATAFAVARACTAKKDRLALARHFGYGVPRLDRALASAQNDLALIAQTYIQPFKREQHLDDQGREVSGGPAFNEVHYYNLPWPRQALEDLGERDVRLKITLSYFIEPSPGETAPVTPARYQSYGLRYDLKRPTETAAVFRQRINRLERDGTQLPKADSDPRWVFGSQSVAAGSLHCDVWVGPAVELATRNLIAIRPVSGWWRHRPQLGQLHSRARYGLVVSITAEDVEIELYTEIANQIGIGIETEIAG